MADSLRTFIAFHIHPGKELLDVMNIFKQELKDEKIKWVDPGNMHVTLKFLGDTSLEVINEINIKLEAALQGVEPISLAVAGTGFFKSGRHPGVLFAKLENTARLKVIYEIIEEQLSAVGIPKDSRRFKPHLTLARINYLNKRSTFLKLTDEYSQASFQEEYIRNVVFFSSKLSPQGPVYHPLKIFAL